MGFYLYGPKADVRLRKDWREPWPKDYLRQLERLARSFHLRGVQFSVALSPVGLAQSPENTTHKLLEAKCGQLRDVGIDFIGLFFDDMPSSGDLADRQLDALEAIRSSMKLPILFCPSYYSTDPILDQVFGTRPPGYLERLGRDLPSEVQIAWTGPKVISPEISVEHLAETARLLNRKPLVCDNFFANDGPRNCKFLKLLPARGRSGAGLQASSFWSFNLMNQSALSQLMVGSAKKVLLNGIEPEEALHSTVVESLSPPFASALLRDQELFTSIGLDKMTEDQKERLAERYAAFPDQAAREVSGWLRGAYLVGSECLTD